MSIPKPDSNLYKIRHSGAHILAQAVKRLYPEALPTIGPVIEHGFFYDFFIPNATLTIAELEKIETEMRKIVAANYPIEGEQVPFSKAREIYSNNKFKLEIIDSLEGETAGIYTQGEFKDLCRGGHTLSTGEVQHFKLTGVSGAYWRADCTREGLQRIYAIAFQTEAELSNHIKMIEEAKLYDHKLLGKKLDLFSFSNYAPGSVFFHPKGAAVFNALVEYSRSIQRKFNYLEIKTPLVLKEEFWKTSGHYENYKENMFFVNAGKEEEGFAIRPMNCPCAMIVYSQDLRSYKELPMRLSEYGMCHRNELSGTLNGLFRARVFTQDDAHIFCTDEQMEEVVFETLEIADIIYKKFGFNKIKMGLSTRPEKSIGTDLWWEKATKALENALVKSGKEFEIFHGEGAFYGPKIEIQVTDALGREWTCGTVQIDPNLPERFGLKYVDNDQSRKTPVAIHRAIFGSIERFFAILLEHSRGRLPFFVAPIQAKILTISSDQNEWANSISNRLEELSIRVEIDNKDQMISNKIKQAQQEQVPLMIIVGKKEVENNNVSVRTLDGKSSTMFIEDLLDLVIKYLRE